MFGGNREQLYNTPTICQFITLVYQFSISFHPFAKNYPIFVIKFRRIERIQRFSVNTTRKSDNTSTNLGTIFYVAFYALHQCYHVRRPQNQGVMTRRPKFPFSLFRVSLDTNLISGPVSFLVSRQRPPDIRQLISFSASITQVVTTPINEVYELYIHCTGRNSKKPSNITNKITSTNSNSKIHRDSGL